MAIEDEIIRAAGREVANRMMPTRRDDYQRHDRAAYPGRDRSRSPRSLSSNSYSNYSGSSRGVSPSHGRHDAASEWGHRASYGRDTFRDYRDSRYGGRSPPRRHSPRRRSPSPVRRSYDKPGRYYGGARPGGYRGRGSGRGGARGGHPRREDRQRPRREDDYAREQDLRRAAIDSRTATWQRTIFPPDASMATRDRAGHPLFPDVEDGEDDELRSALEEVKPPAQYEGREKERHEKALLDERNGHIFRKVTDTPSLERTGLWTTAGPITTHAQAVNLMRWVHHGDPTAMEFLRRTVTRLGTDPTLPRTIGEVTTLQYQNQAMARYNATVNGEREPVPKLTNAGHAPTVTHGAHQAVPGAGPPRPYDAMDEDDPMPADTDASHTQVPDEGPAVFLGCARRATMDTTIVHLPEHPHTDTMARHGTMASIARAVRWYGNVPTSHWPLGLRTSPSELPTTTSASPWPHDVGAWFTLNALSPKRGESSVDRSAFLKIAIRILSVKGFFDKYATLAGYLLNDLPLEHFPFPGVNVSFAHVIAWLMQHGIDKGSEALLALESFACARRRHAAGETEDLQTSLFNDDWPHCPNDADNIVLRPEDLWTGLQFGSPRPGETTDFPSHPAGAPATMESGKVYPPLPPSPKDDSATSTGA
ncbi:hypothetical protein C8R47DRAFT_1214030 [Mycena vitilis]|nr:hypothetical protein C8R47DRAFT_1214030 [Mycena vitilis]